jgi:hypothetical protein
VGSGEANPLPTRADWWGLVDFRRFYFFYPSSENQTPQLAGTPGDKLQKNKIRVLDGGGEISA